jgi:hypothetical protein
MPTSSAVAGVIAADQELANQQAHWPDIAALFQPARDALAVKLKEAKLTELRQRKAAIEAEEAVLLSGADVEPEPETPSHMDCGFMTAEQQRQFSRESGLRQTIAAMQRRIAERRRASGRDAAGEAGLPAR